MKLWHNKTLIDPKVSSEFRSKVTALCYTKSNKFLAVATSDRLISIFDENGIRVDKFSTKPNNKGPKDYIVRSIQFGPEIDNPKLLVGQSDSIVFVYKWSTKNHAEESVWDGKKSICNKFEETSPIVSALWPHNTPTQCVYALMEGKIKIGNMKTNRSQLVYSIESCAVSLSLNIAATELLSGHSDGSIYKFTFPTDSSKGSCSKIITHSHPPYLLSWGDSICVLDDSVMTFYGMDGNVEQVVEAGGLSSKGYSTICASPSGNSIVAGAFDSFDLFVFDINKRLWNRSIARSIQNMCSVTALTWTSNGSRLALGTSTGLLDSYDVAYRHYIYKGVYEITYVSLSEVIVRNLEIPNASPTVLSSSQEEIISLNIYPDIDDNELRYLIAKTKKSMILCDLSLGNAIQPFEFEWYSGDSSQETFIFDAPEACIISNAGELTIVEVRG